MAKSSPKTLQTRVYNVVKQIPKGRVLTYGIIAKLSGIKNPRFVGSILHKNKDPENIPCHRVVNFQGKVAKSYAFGGVKAQAGQLQAERVEVVNGKVNLARFLWYYRKNE